MREGAKLVSFDIEKEKNKVKVRGKDLDPRKAVFQLYQECEVCIDIILEVWNVDDRVLRDKNHRARASSEHKVLSKSEFIDKRMSAFGQMDFLRNKYQDYA